MIKFTRSTKKKLDKVRHSGAASSSAPQSAARGGDASRSVNSAYSQSQHSQYSEYTEGTSGQYSQGGVDASNRSGRAGGGHARHRQHRSGAGGSSGGNRRYSSAQSVASISSASVFAPSVVSGAQSQGGQGGLQPSSARLLRDLNASARSSLLSSLGNAASRTFRSYKMSLPRCPPPVQSWSGSASSMTGSGLAVGEGGEVPPIETDLELLGRTVHAVSSALTEPPKEGDRFMIYDVSFNPKGCVWDALIVVQVKDDGGDDDTTSKSSKSSRRGSTKGGHGSSRMRSRSRSTSRSSRSLAGGGSGSSGGNKTFTFPIRVTCAEDDDVEPIDPSRPRAKTYAVDLSVIDDSVHHPISRWSAAEAAEHRDDIKNAMEWVSYGIRRSMARSMFPQFPEGCQGRPFREVYQLNKKLKSGTFSTVCRGVHRATGRQVAVKCILRKKIEPSVDAAVFEEVLIMSGLHHRYICPMIDYFEEDRCHFVVMELEKGGDLCERLNDKVTYSEPDAQTTIRNICEAMEFVHSKGFAHCDIKPRNYLLRSKRDDVDIRLADFGFAQHVHAPNSLTSQCGTPFFVAPEVINRKPYDQKVDMWSIGVTTYLLLCGDTPFNGKNRQQLFRRISCDEPTFPDEKWGHVSDEAVEFVRSLLTKDPSKRLSSSQALQHRWLAEDNSMTEQQQQQHVSSVPAVSAVDPAEILPEKKKRSSSRAARTSSRASRRGASRSSSRARVKSSPEKQTSVSSPRSKGMPSSRPSKGSEGKSRANRSLSRDRTSNGSLSERIKARSMSRERRSAAPPPPPKPQAARERTQLNSSVTSAVDENARLMEVIKSQDAKIEKLEAMMKKMLDPDGGGTEC